jgi:hypothetical protein
MPGAADGPTPPFLVEAWMRDFDARLRRIEARLDGLEGGGVRDEGEPATCSVSEYAALTGASEWVIYEGIKRGEIPTIPGFGRRKLIPRRWVNSTLNP